LASQILLAPAWFPSLAPLAADLTPFLFFSLSFLSVPMPVQPSDPPRRRASGGGTSGVHASRSPLTVKLQILGAVVVPMLLLGFWLASKGFFNPA
jgi:hypothetical protein